MKRRRPVCGLKGCNLPRKPKKIFCATCWDQLPGWLRAAIAKARWARDAVRLTDLVIQASDHLSGARPAIDPNTARIAAVCGDHEAA